MQKWILKQFFIVALLHAPTPPQKIKKSISVLHFTIFILVDNFVKIAHNFPFVTIPIYKKGIIDMRK
jgi:hypothetical protein